MMDRDRADLRVVVHVLGTSMPPTARRLQVELQPGPSAAHDSGELCPVVHATGTVNGLPLRLRWDGGWKTYECGVLLYDRELPADLPSELLGEATSSGLGFDVMPSVMPSMGVVSFEGGSGFSAFGGIVTRCSGAQTCLAERSICGDTVGCEYGVAYGGGFDRLELPASVALP